MSKLQSLVNRCGKCSQTKPVELFNAAKKRGRNPYQRYCKECQRIVYAEWHRKNRERKLSYVHEWYEKNREHVKAYDAARNATEENKEKTRTNREANKERYLAYGHKHRSLKRNSQGIFTGEDIERIKRLQNNRCAGCGDRLTKIHRVNIITL